MKNAVFPLFCSPIMVCAERYRFSETERRFFDGLEMADNLGNRMSVDTRILDGEPLAGIRAFIEAQLYMYKKQLLRMRDDNRVYITQSWLNTAAPGQHHPRHKHPNSLISGVLFVSDGSGTKQPPVRFHRTAELFPLELMFDDLNEFNAGCRVFDPEQGRLILFPSLVEHDVERNASDRDRTTLSFNTFVGGVIGGDRQLTELALPKG